MKKLITLLLAVAGMVSTASAKTIYFANNFSNINSLKLYLYTNEGETKNADFPGVDFPLAEDYTIDGYSVYALDLGNYEKFIISFYYDDNNSWRRESQPTSCSAYNNNDAIDFSSSWTDNKVALTSALTVYDYSFSIVANEGIALSNIYLYQDGDLTGSWPGEDLVNGGSAYSYSHKSFKPSISTVIFNNGNNTHQTGNLWATPGTNTYFIATITSTKNNTYNTYGQGVEIKESGYATAVSKSPLSIPSGIAYYATDDRDGNATAHILTSPNADVPMLVKGNANTIYAFAAASSGTDNTSENAFCKGKDGNLGANEDGGYNYILKGGEFYLANGNYVSSEKAYLKLSVEAKGRVLRFFDNEETSISGITTMSYDSEGCYNLNGQRIANPSKGLFIRNGKKVLVK